MLIESLLLIPVAIAGALIAITGIVTLPRVLLLGLCVLVRTASDLGGEFGASGPLLPSTAISAFIAVALIAAALLPSQAELSQRGHQAVAMVVVAVIFWTAVSVINFGQRSEFFGESLRAISIICLAVLAYKVGQIDGLDLPRLVSWLVGLPALFLVLSYSAGWTPTILPGANRAMGSFSHPNAAAAFFAVGTIVAVWAFGQSRTRTSFVGLLLCSAALLLTQSLGGIAAAGIGVLVFFLLNARLRPTQRIALLLFALLVAVVLFFWIGPSQRLSELEGFQYGNAADSNSLDWRIVNWQMLIPLWWENAPLTGFGFGSTRYEVQPLGTYPHSIFVQILVEMGLMGAVVTLSVAAMLAKSIGRRYRAHPQSSAALVAIIATVVVHGAAANWLNYSAGQYLAVLTIGLLLGSSRPVADENIAPRRHVVPGNSVRALR